MDRVGHTSVLRIQHLDADVSAAIPPDEGCLAAEICRDRIAGLRVHAAPHGHDTKAINEQLPSAP